MRGQGVTEKDKGRETDKLNKSRRNKVNGSVHCLKVACFANLLQLLTVLGKLKIRQVSLLQKVVTYFLAWEIRIPKGTSQTYILMIRMPSMSSLRKLSRESVKTEDFFRLIEKSLPM